MSQNNTIVPAILHPAILLGVLSLARFTPLSRYFPVSSTGGLLFKASFGISSALAIQYLARENKPLLRTLLTLASLALIALTAPPLARALKGRVGILSLTESLKLYCVEASSIALLDLALSLTKKRQVAPPPRSPTPTQLPLPVRVVSPPSSPQPRQTLPAKAKTSSEKVVEEQLIVDMKEGEEALVLPAKAEVHLVERAEEQTRVGVKEEVAIVLIEDDPTEQIVKEQTLPEVEGEVEQVVIDEAPIVQIVEEPPVMSLGETVKKRVHVVFPSFSPIAFQKIMQDVPDLVGDSKKSHVRSDGSKVLFFYGGDIRAFQTTGERGAAGSFNEIRFSKKIVAKSDHADWIMKTSMDNDGRLKKEYEILTHLNKDGGHPGIPHHVQIATVEGEKNRTVLFMPKYKCDLADFISDDKYKNEYKKLGIKGLIDFSIRIVEAYLFCLEMDIIKTDMKRQNVVLDSNNNPVLIDCDGAKKTKAITFDTILKNENDYYLNPLSPTNFSAYDGGRADIIRAAIQFISNYIDMGSSKPFRRLMNPRKKGERSLRNIEKKYGPPQLSDRSDDGSPTLKSLFKLFSTTSSRYIRELFDILGFKEDRIIQHPKEIREMLVKVFIENRIKIDVFGTGVLLSRVFFGDLIKEKNKPGVFNITFPEQAFPFQVQIFRRSGFNLDLTTKMDDVIDWDRFNTIPEDVRELLLKMLTVEPRNRPDFEEVRKILIELRKKRE
ncbi:MAG: hypothetical protein K1060chlam2_00193 [Chlamydiae bacterium]|nr:hypothetical protein [Chlamydiota bacterium]